LDRRRLEDQVGDGRITLKWDLDTYADMCICEKTCNLY